MTRHLFVTSTLGLLPATSSFAQTAADPVRPDMTAAANWPVGVTTVVFADQTMTTLRAADEIRAQWATLSETDQTRVMQDCAAMRADAGTTVPAGEDISAAGEAMTGSGGATTQGDGSASDTGATVPAAEGSAATDTTLAEGSGMTAGATGAGGAGSIRTQTLTEICALVTTP